MSFCDKTNITVLSGSGGDGCASFRREKYVAKGGPHGGNGGKGGDVIIMVNPHLNSLIDLHTKKYFKANPGKMGSSYLKNGESAEDFIIEVPVGTLLSDPDTEEVIADLNTDNMSVIVAHGGRGGYGNAHFTSSTRQAPRFAELGEPGEEISLTLELQLVADIGIIGLPSVGKSTLISRISAAKPKIAEYHFTTLVPNLGVVRLSSGRSLVVCDIPGLIKGAHEGKGLGDQFLRHISRSRVLVHLVDVSQKDLAQDYATIRTELKKYSKELFQKKEIVAFNKIDTLQNDKDLLKMITKEFCQKTRIAQKNIFSISAITGVGIPELLEEMWKGSALEKKSLQKPQPSLKKQVVLKPHLKDAESAKKWHIEPEKNGFRIYGTRIEQIAVMTNYENPEAVMRLRDVFKKLGIEKALLRLGAQMGAKLFLKDKELEFVPSVLKK